MTTDNSDGSPNRSTAALAVAEGGKRSQSVIEELSDGELGRSSCCVSARLNRSFVGRTEYEGEKALDAALAEAQQALPEVPSEYKPTGKTTVAATVLMLIVAPLILLLLLAICVGLCWGFEVLLSHWAPEDSYSPRRGVGILSLLLDLILVIVMVMLPAGAFSVLSKWFKNRNPTLPAVLTGVIDLIVAVVLFVPVWKGHTLAPTDLTFVFIPVRWILIGIGGLIVPLLGAAVVHGLVSGQKFCEETGRYLRRMRQVKLAFDFGENAVALLRRRQYIAATQLPRATEEGRNKHTATLSLWGHEEATTAFLELDLRFAGKSKPQGKLESAKDKSKEWRVFSVQLTRSECESLKDAM